MTKTAFIAIVGCPNVGKSSTLNRLLGKKVAIVSEKPQTTRTKITGILTKDETQLVFIDTPGFHRPRNKLGEKMVKSVSDSIDGVDACLFVVGTETGIKEKEKELIRRFEKEKMPVILAINKVDKLADKQKLMIRIAEMSACYDFEAVAPISALNGDNFDGLIDELEKLARPSAHFYPSDELTDQPERVIAAEIVREKLLRTLDKEIPHGTAVSVEKMSERGDKSGITDIDVMVYCEKKSHKGIIIGKRGDTLKQVLTEAREDMERFFCCHINLKCWVKVKEDWRNKESLIRNFGLDM